MEGSFRIAKCKHRLKSAPATTGATAERTLRSIPNFTQPSSFRDAELWSGSRIPYVTLGSSPCSQQPSMGPYSEPYQSILRLHIPSQIHFNIIIPPALSFPVVCFPLAFRLNSYTHFLRPHACYKQCPSHPLDYIILIIIDEGCISRRSSSRRFVHTPVPPVPVPSTSVPVRPLVAAVPMRIFTQRSQRSARVTRSSNSLGYN